MIPNVTTSPRPKVTPTRKRERIRKVKKVQVTVTLTPRLLNEIDAVASELEVGRAVVIASASQEYINRHFKKMFRGAVTASALAAFILETDLFEPGNEALRADLEQAAGSA